MLREVLYMLCFLAEYDTKEKLIIILTTPFPIQDFNL